MVEDQVLVTVGAGFIGSHGVDRLLALGARVVVLDDLSTGRRSNLPNDARVRFVLADAADPAAVAGAMDGCTRVVHLAAVASVQRSVEDPIGTHRANLIAALRVLEATHAVGVERLVCASSAAVYGDDRTSPVVEEGSLAPQTPYVVDKLAGLHYLAYYRRAFGMRTVALRFFNVYGPRQLPDSPYSGEISRFADQVLRRQPITVYGDGLQSRDFVEVGDVVHAVVAWRVREPAPEAFVMNVGTGVATSVLDLIDALQRVAGIEVPVVFVAARVGDVRHSAADAGQLRCARPDWSPRPLDSGLRRLLDVVDEGYGTGAGS